MYEMGGALPV